MHPFRDNRITRDGQGRTECLKVEVFVIGNRCGGCDGQNMPAKAGVKRWPWRAVDA
jgi:hypothetical protein